MVAEANNADGIIRDATGRDATGRDATGGDATSSEGFPHMNDPDAVWVTRGLEKAVGDSVQLLINDHARAYVVRGVIPDSAKMGTDAILMDIGAAQMATGKFGRVDRILIKTPDSNN